MNYRGLLGFVVQYCFAIPTVLIASLIVIFWEPLYGQGRPSSVFGQTLILLTLIAFIYENGYKKVKRQQKSSKLFYIGYVVPGVFAILGYLYTLLIR
jgi:hypothetical protein